MLTFTQSRALYPDAGHFGRNPDLAAADNHKAIMGLKY